MAGSIGGKKMIASEEDERVSFNVIATTYLLKAVTGFGYLALTWSTVVLLGGFVTVLHKKDFWCLTVISMTQAARIFNDFAERLVRNLVIMLAGNIAGLASREFGKFRSVVGDLRRTPAALSKWCWVLRSLYIGTVVLPFQAISCVTLYLYRYSGPVVCIALALWRIAQRDYGGDASSNGNLMPALDLFYSLVLLQGVLYMVWALWPLLNNFFAVRTKRVYRQQLDLPDQQWCRRYLSRYLSDTRARCWRQPGSVRGRRLLHFAVESLDSGSWEEMLLGVRMLDAYVVKGEDIRPQLLPSRPRVQKLIHALGSRQPDGARKMREPAARIVAHLASNIHLSQFPGAMECISSLLHQEETTTLLLTNKQDDDGGSSSGGGPNQLILQGLAILEGLAFDGHNCRVICSTPGLLRKVMAPLSSASLIDDISNNIHWVRVVSRSLKVLYKLLQATGKTSRRLRREICTSKQAMSNLDSILQHTDEAKSSDLEELHVGAMVILTQLALDLSVNLSNETKENLVKKQLRILLADGEEGQQEPVPELKPLKAMAGRALVLLSAKSGSNSALIMTIQNDILDRLGVVLHANKGTAYRTIAAQILDNLCAHCDLDKQWIKETLLPKVLAEILSSKKVAPENGVSPPIDEEKQQNSAQEDDTEIQETSLTAEQNKSSDAGNEEETTTTKLMREAFLSLALVIRDKLITADEFDDAVQKVGVGPAAFVTKMKAIVEDNCQETAESLRIVKLCCRIVEPMMQRDQYAQHFRNKGFVESVAKASEIMSNLESCMLFAGTDFGLKNTMRPLLSDLKN